MPSNIDDQAGSSVYEWNMSLGNSDSETEFSLVSFDLTIRFSLQHLCTQTEMTLNHSLV